MKENVHTKKAVVFLFHATDINCKEIIFLHLRFMANDVFSIFEKRLLMRK